MIPTIQQVMKRYELAAKMEAAKTERPGEKTVENVLCGTLLVCEAADIKQCDPVTALTRQRIDLALARLLSRDIRRISVWSYINQLQGLFAKWTRPYYEDMGWKIPPLELPVFRARAPRYERPSAALLESVKAWYKTLTGASWFVATMMLEFAMRNGDVLRLKDSNFITREVQVGETREKRRFLSYTPHKTALSSGRTVCWPVHDEIWKCLEANGGVENLAVTEATFAELNRALRKMGFRGSKGAYELRKICIDHIYQKYGAEMAVSLSGDDIKTITRYYADPTQVNIGAVRVIDLL